MTDVPEEIRPYVGILDQIIERQRPLVLARLRAIRKSKPYLTPEQVLRKVESEYLTAVSTSGAAVGATAAVPGLGTAGAIGVVGAEAVAFFEATCLFAIAYTEVHGTHLEDKERAKSLVYTLLLGDAGATMVHKVGDQYAGRNAIGTQYWAPIVTQFMPSGVVQQLNTNLRNMLVRRAANMTASRTAGKLIPFGIGAVVGGVGNHVLGRRVVTDARRAFGPPPRLFTTQLDPRPNQKKELRALEKAEKAQAKEERKALKAADKAQKRQEKADKQQSKVDRAELRRRVREDSRELGLSGIIKKNHELAAGRQADADGDAAESQQRD